MLVIYLLDLEGRGFDLSSVTVANWKEEDSEERCDYASEYSEIDSAPDKTIQAGCFETRS